MDKQNIFKSCSFHANAGDVVHVLVKDLTGAGFVVSLNDGEGNAEDIETIENPVTTTLAPLLDLMDKDGNIYTTVTIGAKEWIIESLKTTTYADDTVIPNLTANGDWIADVTGAYCWYNNDIGYKTPYGALYNWYAVNNAHGLAYLERGGIEETGWRVPSNVDWSSIGTTLGGAGVAGGAMKEIGTSHWTTPNTGATNSSGFTGVGSGHRDPTLGTYLVMGDISDLWSANSGSGYFLAYSNDDLTFQHWGLKAGLAVRLVRDL